MYIVAHNTTDVSKDILDNAESLGINIRYIRTDFIFNHDWLNSIVHSTQRKLLESYDYVVYTDCDEIISPVGSTLKDFLSTANLDLYRCIGYNVIEKKLSRDTMYDKTLITKVPLIYEYGYHTSSPNVNINNNLILYHIHKIDYQECFKRNLRLAKESWDEKAVSGNLSFQNRISEENSFREWFYNASMSDITEHALNTINQIYTYENELEKK